MMRAHVISRRGYVRPRRFVRIRAPASVSILGARHELLADDSPQRRAYMMRLDPVDRPEKRPAADERAEAFPV